jgi:hypothetical protein
VVVCKVGRKKVEREYVDVDVDVEDNDRKYSRLDAKKTRQVKSTFLVERVTAPTTTRDLGTKKKKKRMGSN